MKITIDLEKKTVFCDQAQPLCKIIEQVQRMFPDTWREYSLEFSVSSPIIFPVTYPVYPFNDFITVCSAN